MAAASLLTSACSRWCKMGERVLQVLQQVWGSSDARELLGNMAQRALAGYIFLLTGRAGHGMSFLPWPWALLRPAHREVAARDSSTRV